MLFLLRALAVWKNNRFVVVLLGTLWIALVRGVIIVPIGIRGAHIGPTLQCVITAAYNEEEIGPIIVIIYDSVIFVTIAYRILFTAVYEDGVLPRLHTFFGSKKSIPNLSRALLRGGQKYYL